MEEEVLAPARACERCGGALVWEAVREREEERWLGVCAECGWLVAFLPDQPRCSPRDPLRVFLLGTGAEARAPTPPWIRLFRASTTPPWNVVWLHASGSCAGCDTQVTFATRTLARPGVLARCLLCLTCGQATVEHLRAARALRETPVVGTRWAPPDVGVARLREAVFRPFWREQWLDEGE